MSQKKTQLNQLNSSDFYDDNNSSSNISNSKLDSPSMSSGCYYIMDSRNSPVSSIAMPIPRTTRAMTDFSSYFDLDQSQSESQLIIQDTDLTNFSISDISAGGSSNQGGNAGTISESSSNSIYGMQQNTSNSNAMWGIIGDAISAHKTESFHMEDDDDIFQVDKADLYHGPTLAELNDELGYSVIDEFILPEDNGALLLAVQHPTLTVLQSAGNSSQVYTSHLQQNNHNQQQPNHQQHNPSSHHQLHIHSPQPNTMMGQDMYEESNQNSSSPFDIYQTTPTKSINSRDALSPLSNASSNSPNLLNSVSPPLLGFNNNNNNNIQHKSQYSTLQELLKKDYSISPERPQLGQSVPGPSGGHLMHHQRIQNQEGEFSTSSSHRRVHLTQQNSSRLSSSAPTNATALWESHQMWQRREPRQHLLSTSSMAEAGSTSSLSTGGILSPEAHDFSHDEGYEDSDSDHYEDYSTDNGMT